MSAPLVIRLLVRHIKDQANKVHAHIAYPDKNIVVENGDTIALTEIYDAACVLERLSDNEDA